MKVPAEQEKLIITILIEVRNRVVKEIINPTGLIW